jgi:hypothetical protein
MRPGFKVFVVETLKLCNLETCSLSLLAAPYLEVETHDSVLVAQRYDRNCARDVVLRLDDLLV